MSRQRRATLELVLAVVAAAGAVWSWFGAQTTVTVAPILEVNRDDLDRLQPADAGADADAGDVAGVLAVDGIARLRGGRGDSPR